MIPACCQVLPSLGVFPAEAPDPVQQMSRPCCAPPELLPRGGRKLTTMAVRATEGGVVSPALVTAALLRPAPCLLPVIFHRVSLFSTGAALTELPFLSYVLACSLSPLPSGCWSSHVCACWCLRLPLPGLFPT